MHWLTLLLITPLIGAAIVAALPGDRALLIRRVALASASLSLLIAVRLWFLFDPSVSQLQFYEHYIWNPRLGTAYALGIDGISYPMVLLATLLCLVALMASRSIKQRPKGYYLLILVLESAMMGVFMAQDWALFYVFWELTLIPLFFLIDRWGGKNRQGASLNFVLYTMGGSVFMLISLLLLFDAVPGHSFHMSHLSAGAKLLPENTQLWIFIGLLIGFGVKMPIFPIHGWLPLAHVEAPSPISILLSGILLKMGSYGLIRAAETLPLAVISLQDVLAGFALVSLIYGGLLAWRQTDMKAMIAYSSVSHMGVVLLGIAALNFAGISGALTQMVAHGLVAGALFLLIGLLYERTGTRDVSQYSSLVKSTPRFAFFTTLAFIGAVGLPGTAGFIAELHALIGGFQRWGWWVLLLSLGVLISAAYAIRTVGRLFTGPVRRNMQNVPDLRQTELLAAAALTLGTVMIGVFPAPLLDLMSVSVDQLTSLFSGVESHIFRISQMIENFSGKRIADNTPIIGADVFTQTSGIHADGDKKGHLYESDLVPERFSRRRYYALGKMSGKASLVKNLEHLDITLSEENQRKVLKRIIELGDSKKIITTDDLPFIIADVLDSKDYDHIRLINCTVTSSLGQESTATIEVDIQGDISVSSGTGNGGFNAFANAVKKVLRRRGIDLPNLQDFEVRIPKGGRSEALTECIITWEGEPNSFKTRGVHANQVFAAINATLRMLNMRLHQEQQEHQENRA